METLSEYLRSNFKRNVIDHTIRASVDKDDVTTFYIHPMNVNGETLDFEVSGNRLYKLPKKNKNIRTAIEYLYKDIYDRRGIGEAFDEVDEETRDEMFTQWYDIIERCLDEKE